jgi:hypothetical protein
MNNEDEMSFVEVFMGYEWEAQLVKNLLENEGIEALIQEAMIGTLAPFNTGGTLGGVKVMVWEKDYAKAKEVVNHFNSNRSDLLTNFESLEE